MSNNLRQNFPVMVADSKHAVHVYGTDVSALKGKMTKQHNGSALSSSNPTPIPNHICKGTKERNSRIDFFYVQGIPFLRTISRNIKFRTAWAVDNRQKKKMLEEIKNIIKMCTDRSFKVVDIHGDQEFKCIVDDMSPTSVDIVATDDHVDEVER